MLTNKKVGIQVNILENPYETQLSKRIDFILALY
jgi:hypothetical protein